MRRDVISRVDKEFNDIVKQIANEKLRNRTARAEDRESFSNRRITLAMSRHPDMKKIMKDIEKAEWEGDNPSRFE